jgi:hypothetical protein
MPVPEFLSQGVASWASLYGNSKAISVGVTYAHLGGLLLGGGAALDADRQIMRAHAGAAAERAACMARAPAVHRTVITSLGLVIFTGILMFGSDVETFAGSKVFWFKMAMVALLLANGAFLYRTEKAIARDDSARNWSRLKFASIASLSLWACVLLVGTILRTAA